MRHHHRALAPAAPRAEIRTRTNIARRRPALWGPGKHLGRHDFRPSRARCGVRAPAAAPPRPRHVPRACAGCRIIDRPVPGAGRGRKNRAAPQSAATVSGPDRWAGAGGRRSPYGPARTSGRYGSGARCSIGASAKVIFGDGAARVRLRDGHRGSRGSRQSRLIARALDGGAQVGKGPECARGARVVRWEGARRADFWRPPPAGASGSRLQAAAPHP